MAYSATITVSTLPKIEITINDKAYIITQNISPFDCMTFLGSYFKDSDYSLAIATMLQGMISIENSEVALPAVESIAFDKTGSIAKFIADAIENDEYLKVIYGETNKSQTGEERFVNFCKLMLDDSAKRIVEGFKKLRPVLEQMWETYKCNPFLIDKYGWHFAFQASKELREKPVFRSSTNLEQAEVDKVVLDFFSSNNYDNLIQMVDKWAGSTHFSCRKHIFEEALANHVDSRYLSSVTLLSVHTEGVIADYLMKEKSLGKITTAISKLVEITSIKIKQEKLSGIDIIALNYFVAEIYNSGFDGKNPSYQPARNGEVAPQPSHSLSRHKIAHGQVKCATEKDSLKCFLHLNALYDLFAKL